MTEKLAACLCELRRGDDWLIPEHLRLRGTAKEICAYVQWDHATPWAWTADNRPQNLTPMAPATHRAKTARDVKAIAKVRRNEKRAAGQKRRGRSMQFTALKGEFHRDFMTGKVTPR